MAQLSMSEQWTLLRIAEAATPPGTRVRLPDARTVDAVQGMLDQVAPSTASAYRALIHTLDLAAVPLTGSRLSSLSAEEREQALVRLSRGETTFWLVRAVTLPIKIAQSEDEDLENALGVRDGQHLPLAREHHRWEERIVDARTLTKNEELEVDVVVVGTGAGGAPMAKALASRGHAVVMLEEGAHFTRADFHGRPIERQNRLYRDHGLTVTLGNTVIPVPMGRTVGGSTTVNSGTCYRTPERVLRRWQFELGLHELGPGSLDPYFESVEKVLEVEPTKWDVLGGVARAIARGAEALGYEHGPLSRNAPGCDAQALCCFGCPTDAKRSTNVSYVPQALGLGAMLYCNALVTEVIVEGGRAVGVKARARSENGSAKTITVRARAVVLACGTVYTPALLLRQGLANSSDQVGRNLTIHPCSYVWAAFREPIRGFEEVPQGYAVEEFADQGIRFEGGFPPLAIGAAAFVHVGKKWTELVERYDELACFGFMIADSSRGRVTLGAGGAPRMTYWVNDADVRTVVRGQGILARIFLAAGATRIYPGMQCVDDLTDLDDVERFERDVAAQARAHHLDLSAYHPLGTCQIGSDPKRSVIGPSHECHDVSGLFVCDGSSVPGPLGVNPQVTIMALSERASQFVERRVEEGSRPRRAPAEGAQVKFDETMSGMCSLEASEGGGTVEVSFTVRALGGTPLRELLRQRGNTMTLTGTITIDGIANAVPCEGTLAMRPLERRATLVYDLAFNDDQGQKCTLHGEKHTGLLHPLRGMRTLYTELRREGFLLGRGVLTFDVENDLAPWLASFGLAS